MTAKTDNPRPFLHPTLHALTDQLARHARASRALGSTGLDTDRLRQPAPPPQLPVLSIGSQHQDIARATGPVCVKGQKVHPMSFVHCPVGISYPPANKHVHKKWAEYDEEDVEGFVMDMGMVLRREYDCWVEQCW